MRKRSRDVNRGPVLKGLVYLKTREPLKEFMQLTSVIILVFLVITLVALVWRVEQDNCKAFAGIQV